jgi:uncharacterized membrane protein (DUF2068 family)
MRPLGVTLIGAYQILRGVLGVLFGLCLLVFTGLAGKLASLASEGNAVSQILHNLGRMAGLGVIAFAILHILAGFGLLKMQNWGRLLTLLLSAIGLVILLPVLVAALGLPLIFAAINAASIFYLAMPPVKRVFHAVRPVVGAAA